MNYILYCVVLIVGFGVVIFLVKGKKWFADDDPYDSEEEYDITSERLETRDFKTLKPLSHEEVNALDRDHCYAGSVSLN